MEVTCRKEVLSLGVELDTKVEGHKQYLENAVNNVHSSLKNQILIDQDVVKKLTDRVEQLEKMVEGRLNPIEN